MFSPVNLGEHSSHHLSMKVWGVLVLCAVLFFSVTFSSPSENEDLTIEKAKKKNTLAQENLSKLLHALKEVETEGQDVQLQKKHKHNRSWWKLW